MSTKLSYGVASVADGSKTAAFNVFLLFYYNQVLGLPGTLGGLAIIAALCIDTIVDAGPDTKLTIIGAIQVGGGARHLFVSSVEATGPPSTPTAGQAP